MSRPTPSPVATAVLTGARGRLRWGEHLRSYWQLTKPKVVAVIVFTAVIGMLLASRDVAHPDLLLFAALGIWFAAASAAAFNHVFDQKLDGAMSRTQHRPLPSGQLTRRSALLFASLLAVASMLILVSQVNTLTAALTFASLIGYSIVYTVWLKHATPQNIVIGGAAGAAPPVLGWTAVTHGVDANALLLFLIVFTWTPPHFWSLAIARRADYARAGVPMLPVTHGVHFTCTQILIYTILLAVVTTLPFLTGMSGAVYLAGATVLNLRFLRKVLALKAAPDAAVAMRTFRFSINYLMVLFVLLLLDHYWSAT